MACTVIVGVSICSKAIDHTALQAVVRADARVHDVDINVGASVVAPMWLRLALGGEHLALPPAGIVLVKQGAAQEAMPLLLALSLSL